MSICDAPRAQARERKKPGRRLRQRERRSGNWTKGAGNFNKQQGGHGRRGSMGDGDPKGAKSQFGSSEKKTTGDMTSGSGRESRAEPGNK